MVSLMVPFERVIVVAYRLSIVTSALSLTIWPQFAVECLQCSNQGGGPLWGKIWGEGSTDVSQFLTQSAITIGCSM